MRDQYVIEMKGRLIHPLNSNGESIQPYPRPHNRSDEVIQVRRIVLFAALADMACIVLYAWALSIDKTHQHLLYICCQEAGK